MKALAKRILGDQMWVFVRNLWYSVKGFQKRLRIWQKMIPLQDLYKIVVWDKSSNLAILRVKQIGNQPVLVRLGTADNITIRDTFVKQYHLPCDELPSNPTILDLGCNTGYTILHFNHIYPDARIIGIEMDIDNFSLAQLNTRNIKNCTLLNKAVSISNGFIAYNKRGREDGYHINYESSLSSEEEINVESITINSILHHFKLKYIDYMKMDIEGEEVRIFADHVNNLEWLNIVGMLNIEVHGTLSDLIKIISVLKDHNFDARKSDHHESAVVAVKRKVYY